jgi:hypothetical protein
MRRGLVSWVQARRHAHERGFEIWLRSGSQANGRIVAIPAVVEPIVAVGDGVKRWMRAPDRSGLSIAHFRAAELAADYVKRS